MSAENKDYSVSKVVPYSESIAQNLKDSMAILKFNTGWLNRFPAFEGAVMLLDEVVGLISGDYPSVDLSKVPEDKRGKIRLDLEKYYKIKQIWDGGCFITRKRKPEKPSEFIKNSDRFHYDDSKIDRDDPFLEIVPLPSLDDMTPIGKIRDETLLIQISTTIPLYLAYDMMDFETLIREGQLFHYEHGNLKAKFTPDDMDSKVLRTYKVGRTYYFKTIKTLKNKFFELWFGNKKKMPMNPTDEERKNFYDGQLYDGSGLKMNIHEIIKFQLLQEKLFSLEEFQNYENASNIEEKPSAKLELKEPDTEDDYDFEKDGMQIKVKDA